MIVLWIILGIIGFLLLAYLGVGCIICLKFYMPKKKTETQIAMHEVDVKKFDLKLLDIPYEDVRIPSRFGYSLRARYYEAKEKTDRFVILCHGRGNCGIGQMKYLKIFMTLGYNILIPDHRYSGKSGGPFHTYGELEKYDIEGWLRYIRTINKSAEIGIYGESMGAATAIMVAARNLDLKFLIAYCSYSSVQELIRSHYGKEFPKWIGIFEPAFFIVGLLLFGVRKSLLDVKTFMRKVRIPTLIMHSHKDELIFTENAKKLIALNDNASYVFFTDSPHSRSIAYHPEAFSKAIVDFVNNYSL